MATEIPVLEEIKEEKITTVVADDLEIRGAIKFKSSVMLKGIFEGEIQSEGLLVVGPTAKVTATIATKTLVSHGEVTGNVTAQDQVILKQTSTHNGDLKTPYLTVENGAVFNGKSVMERMPTTVSEEKPLEIQVEAPEEKPAAIFDIPQAAPVEEKQPPFVIPRQDQRKKPARDKIPFEELDKKEESTSPAEGTEWQDNKPY
ncbi:MAG TPA: polymer-forming cytoskeletal protein [Syntrophorhabdaceae bacterium]|nr:polymer-forming cytoskeletal protein [Syntrophorhabdaceae bacterium]